MHQLKFFKTSLRNTGVLLYRPILSHDDSLQVTWQDVTYRSTIKNQFSFDISASEVKKV